MNSLKIFRYAVIAYVALVPSIHALDVHASSHDCSKLTAKALNGWSDSTKCSMLSEECLGTIGDLAGLHPDCLNSISPTKLRSLNATRTEELLNGSIGPLGRYADYHIEHQIALMKNLKGNMERLSHDFRLSIWVRPALAMAVLNSFSNGYLAKIIGPEAFEHGPVFLASAVQVDLLRRLPFDIFKTARPDMLVSMPPECFRSLTPTHISMCHPRSLSKLSADHLDMLPEPCFPAMGMGHVACLVGAQTEAETVRLWSAAQIGTAAVKIAFLQHLQRHPCQALRRRRYLLMRAAVPIVETQCRFVWTCYDTLLSVAHNGGAAKERWQLHRFPLIICIVMGVIMTALLVQTCILTLFDGEK